MKLLRQMVGTRKDIRWDKKGCEEHGRLFTMRWFGTDEMKDIC